LAARRVDLGITPFAVQTRTVAGSIVQGWQAWKTSKTLQWPVGPICSCQVIVRTRYRGSQLFRTSRCLAR
jgi:hypothetical protein